MSKAHPITTAVMHLRDWLQRERLPADGPDVEIHLVFRDRHKARVAEDIARFELGDQHVYPVAQVEPNGLKVASIPIRFSSDESEALRGLRALIDAHLSRRS